MSSATAKHIVFVDIPDTDNVMMVYQVLRDFPDEHIAVVLSPRPVDMRVRRYEENFKHLLAKVGKGLKPGEAVKRMIFPLTSSNGAWVESLDEDTKQWFISDADFTNPSVVADTELYMRLSEFRFAELLGSMGFSPDRYTFYQDTELLRESTIRPGVRHAQHVHDFTFGFNAEEMAVYDNAALAHPFGGDAYQEKLRSLCHGYIARTFDSRTKSFRFQDLVNANRSKNVTPYLIVGGPFTEVSKYIHQADVAGVLAMAGFIHGGSNLFPNQFNFHVDLESAKEVLKMVEKKGIPLKLLPTECVKKSAFELDKSELEVIFPGSEAVPVPLIRKVAERYMKDSRTDKSDLFDWIAAIMLKNPSLLPVRKVTPFVTTQADGIEIIQFREDVNGKIDMFWNDEKHMSANRALLLKTMTVPSPHLF